MSANDETRAGAPDPDANPTATHNPDADPEATRIRPSDPSAQSVTGTGVVPGYQIEGALGRGGMGVVYKATQAGLNRIVALKVLIAGQYADPSLRARFLLEAESVAALEHPGIVKVFAFGESGGHPFLAMEFVPGGTLAERIKKNGPLPAKDATELVAKLAAAVAHAHSRGVVHRDIKPLNVLLTADGEPRLTDFGLAKVGRADQNLSVTGQVLGTPAYMAPEQAAGKVHEVGTAADVYARGAVLYDVLTGHPPFRGDSVAVTLQKVITEEPPRPRKLNATIPRDLETICLKCLEKDPAKRYPTAQALADDLLRYARNEPIGARPAGAMERGYKWVKRNKVVAGAITAVVLALLTGAGVSLGFGLEANKQAAEAKQKQKDADDAAEREKSEAARADRERDDAIKARDDLTKTNDELLRSRERTNRTLAKALLGPITANNRDKPLTPYEVETFWQLAELRRDGVSWMFLEEATHAPLACEQLECRAEFALHGAIGLNVERVVATDRLLLASLKSETNPARSVSLALALSRWDGSSPNCLAQAADLLIAALGKATAPDARGYLVRGLSSVVGRMEPAQAAKVCTQAADLLIAALGREVDSGARESLAYGLSSVAKRMEPARGADILIAALGKETGANARQSLAKGLSSVAERMEPTQAARVCAQAADLLIAALGKETNPNTHVHLSENLSSVAERMEPVQGAKVCAQAASILITTLGYETSPLARARLSEGLSALVVGFPTAVRNRSQHFTTFATGAFAAPHNFLPSLPLLHPALHPQPRPLPPQGLVELLKHPFCVGEARRAVLDALEFTYKRPFKVQWEFVEYAQKHQPQLDLLSPPKRPTQP